MRPSNGYAVLLRGQDGDEGVRAARQAPAFRAWSAPRVGLTWQLLAVPVAVAIVALGTFEGTRTVRWLDLDAYANRPLTRAGVDVTLDGPNGGRSR